MRRLLLALILAGCTANGAVRGFVPASSQNAGAPKVHAANGTLTFQVDIPFARRRSAHFISPSTQSAAFVLYPLSGTKRATAYVNLTAATNAHCRALRGIKTLRCRVVMQPQVGQYRASIGTFDGPLGTNGLPTGHKLSANNYLPVYVPSHGVTIALAIYLNGVPHSVRVSASMAGDQSSGFSLNPCQRFPQIFTLTGLDADGNVIIGPGAPTAALQSSAGLTVSPADPTVPNEFEVDADPNSTPGPATLTATMTANGAARNRSATATVNVSTAPVDPDGCLVVGNSEPGDIINVTMYAPGSTEPAETVTDGIDGPYAFAFDGSKNLYVANVFGTAVTEYSLNSATPVRSLPSSEPRAVAADASGNVYTADFNTNTVSVYPPGATTASYKINVVEPAALAFDSSGNLYVASFYVPVQGNGIVSVYAPGSTTPARTMTVGIEAQGMVFDHAGNLYVANGSSNSVTVFAPGASSPSYTITTGVSSPRTLAVDSANNLYVANVEGSNVTVYASGQSTPLRTLSTGRYTWTVAVDSSDRLYVGTSGRVYVYAAGSSTPSLTIRDGIVEAVGLAVTP